MESFRKTQSENGIEQIRREIQRETQRKTQKEFKETRSLSGVLSEHKQPNYNLVSGFSALENFL